MTGHFSPASGGAAVVLSDAEISVLRSQARQLLELLGPAEHPTGGAEGLLDSVFSEGPSRPPTDPVLARLFPDAYGDPDQDPDEHTRAASAEFRRYTENDLRARKQRDALAVIRSLDTLTPGAVLRLKPEECHQWLGALNDLRLAIGTRLGITDGGDDNELLDLPEIEPRKQAVMIYLWLSGMQETLVESLMD